MDGVFVWHWVQQHRVLSVIVLALFIVATAGGTAWALVFRTVSSPVGLAEALRIYRREQTAKVLDSLRGRLPNPGVYTYATAGGEGLSLMGVQRSFPGSTSMVVTEGSCAKVSWVPIEQHTEDTTVCPTASGAYDIPMLVTDESIAGSTTTSSISCPATAYLLPPNAAPGAALGGHLHLGQPGREGRPERSGLRSGHPRRPGPARGRRARAAHPHIQRRAAGHQSHRLLDRRRAPASSCARRSGWW